MASPNTISGLTNTIVADLIFDQFKALIAPLSAFCTKIEIPSGKKGKYIDVGVIGSTGGTTATKTDHADYSMTGVTLGKVQVTLGDEEYVSWSLSDKELSENDFLTNQMFAAQKAKDLAAKVLNDVLGEITIANYATACFSGAAAAFGLSDIVDIRTALKQAYLEPSLCSLVIPSDYYGQLLKELQYNVVGEANAIRNGNVGRLVGLRQVIESELIPANSENLKGFVAHPSAMAVGMRYLEPQDGNTYAEARSVVAEGEAVTGYRRWYDNDSGVTKNIMNCVWGKKKVLNGIMRITS